MHFEKILIIIYNRKHNNEGVDVSKSTIKILAVLILLITFSGIALAQELTDEQYVGYVPGDHGDM